MADLRTTLLERGAANLREFGYPDATKDNILAVSIFRAFFKGMLEENRGKAGAAADLAIAGLLSDIAKVDG